MGFYIGNMLGGPVKEHLGFGVNYSLGMVCFLLAVFWCIFFVKDSKESRDARLRRELHLSEPGGSHSSTPVVRRRSTEKLSRGRNKHQWSLKGEFLISAMNYLNWKVLPKDLLQF